MAAAFALLRQRYPDATVEELEDLLFDAAAREGLSPPPGALPDLGWGWGKLDVYRALYGRARVDSERPEARLSVRHELDRLLFDALDSLDPDGDPLEYRFDVENDGTWERDWAPEATFAVPSDGFSPDEALVVRLDVRDPTGLRHGVLELYAIGGGALDTGLGPDAGDDVGLGADVGPVEPGGDDSGDATTCLCTPLSGRSSPAAPWFGLGLALILAVRSFGRLRRG